MNVSSLQLQKKFKHAADFGVKGTATTSNLAAFEAALQNHVAKAGTLPINGSYRGSPAVLYVDPSTNLVVVTDIAGNFIRGWRLSPQQLQLHCGAS